jgi:hypothetical protein
VLQIRDVYLGSRILIFTHPGSQIQKQQQKRANKSHMFFGLPDPDPLVRGMDLDPALDPDPSIIMQK